MNLRIKSLLTIAFALIVLTTAVQAQVTLRVGSPAPEFKYSKWMKGTEITKFEKGKFYIVEFWATWCGPCKTSIPHLTELAHKYKGKVNIIGMDGSESVPFGDEANKLVTDFLKEMGDKMDYNVAMDTQDKHMSTKWMQAAAQFGIPTAFIVDKDTKIAWIGHPMEMDEPLTKILDGTFDSKEYVAKFSADQDKAANEREEQKKFNEVAKPIADAFKAKEYAKVVSECEALVAKVPSYESKLDRTYFNALLKINPDKAYAIAQAEKAKNSVRTKSIAWLFAQEGIDKKFYSFCIDYLTPLVEKDANDFTSISILASAYEFMGNNVKASELIDKMIVYAKANKAPENYLKQLDDKKAKLKAAK
jgi:thiol-disulfide isomerase/thioredoxin